MPAVTSAWPADLECASQAPLPAPIRSEPRATIRALTWAEWKQLRLDWARQFAPGCDPKTTTTIGSEFALIWQRCEQQFLELVVELDQPWETLPAARALDLRRLALEQNPVHEFWRLEQQCWQQVLEPLADDSGVFAADVAADELGEWPRPGDSS